MWQAWRAGGRRAALAAIPDEVVDEPVVHGTAAACEAHVRRYVEAGATTSVIALSPLDYDAYAAVRLLAPG